MGLFPPSQDYTSPHILGLVAMDGAVELVADDTD